MAGCARPPDGLRSPYGSLRETCSRFPALRVAVLLFAAVAHAQDQDFSKVELKTTKLAPGLAMLEGVGGFAGGNVAVSFGADGPVIVDDQFAPMTPKITAAVRALQDAPIRFVVNTHWHGDHTGGNEPMRAADAVIFAHENVRKRMSVENFSKVMNRKVPAAPAAALPVVTFADGVTLHWNGETIRVEHVAPAHTDGDSLVWFESANAVHMGDTFVNGFYPFIDAESGGTAAGLIAAADRVLARVNEKTKIVPGHGPLAGKADLKKFRDMLADVKVRVERGIASGKTQEQFIAGKPLADLEAEWGDGFMKTDVFLSILWTDLGGK
jgi:glyoxylase-like metal-dependent hydrolase (beta-lactamase superfamily II)